MALLIFYLLFFSPFSYPRMQFNIVTCKTHYIRRVHLLRLRLDAFCIPEPDISFAFINSNVFANCVNCQEKNYVSLYFLSFLPTFLPRQKIYYMPRVQSTFTKFYTFIQCRNPLIWRWSGIKCRARIGLIWEVKKPLEGVDMIRSLDRFHGKILHGIR